MDLLRRIDKLMVDTTVAGDVATNNTKGNIDVVGGKCPDGMVYSKTKKTCVPKTNETIVAAAVAGSGQTRAWGSEWNLIDALETKEPVENKMDDKPKENLNRPDLKFDSLLGAYVPRKDMDIDTNQMENDDE